MPRTGRRRIKRRGFLRLGRRRRRGLVRTPWLSPVVALQSAACAIQAAARGRISRHPGPPRPKRRIYAGTGQRERYERLQEDGDPAAQVAFVSWCAARIQSVARGRQRRRWAKYAAGAPFQIAALQAQGCWRDYRQRSLMRRPRGGGGKGAPAAVAATAISNAFLAAREFPSRPSPLALRPPRKVRAGGAGPRSAPSSPTTGTW